ncbi:hypothetical protein BST14_26490 [Mycobacterium arosiense ATCC BAA-1401 = DSM 45069]|uniref:Uncharacterized protein n=1 Tax=Mycobacterium arosiense ATCC BAA-1401 = DSM 45069 TaxID=1265311 RepID=A0A1W9Z5Y1_MYCAI|nr:hypothetical protein BST14_26490 [Mycobacterium arosiense ATCC BAA-1401 = DSM 45069]
MGAAGVLLRRSGRQRGRGPLLRAVGNCRSLTERTAETRPPQAGGTPAPGSAGAGDLRWAPWRRPAAPRLCRSWRSPLGTMAETRRAPALPELAISASGSLDFSSCVYIGEGPGRQGR